MMFKSSGVMYIDSIRYHHCEKCGARNGERCRSKGGKIIDRCHTSRLRSFIRSNPNFDIDNYVIASLSRPNRKFLERMKNA